MNIDQYALALMALESLLLGAFLEIIFELLRFVCGIFMPRLLRDTSEKNNDIVAIICISVRDFVFLSFGGVAFSVFVYYTNDGNIRFIAVMGTLIGFAACYITVGRIVRRCTAFILNVFYKLINVLLYPFRFIAESIIGLLRKGAISIGTMARRKHTLREIKKISFIKYRGIP